MGEFFGAFKELRDRVASINQNVLINTILSRPEYQSFIVRLNTEVQLFELNVDSNGIKLAANLSGYSDNTLIISEEKGRPKRGRDRVDLHDTGEYYESHAVDIGSLKDDYFTMLSDAQKDETDLVDEWGPILGLTEESMNELSAFILLAFLPLLLETIQDA
jgi:hypothetical protein